MNGVLYKLVILKCLVTSAVFVNGQLEEGEDCQLHNGKIGVCKLISRCKEAVQDIGYGVLSPRCKPRGVQVIVCCELETPTLISTPYPTLTTLSPSLVSAITEGELGEMYSQQNYLSSGTCRTPGGTEATCVDVYKCESMLDVLKTLKPPHSPGVIKRLHAYKCEGLNRVCCPLKRIVDPVLFYHDREEAPDVTGHKNYHLLPKDCGYLDSNVRKIRNVRASGNDRVTGHEDAAINEFPWMALLQYKTSFGLEFLCGGTIITYNYVLTSASCVGTRDTELMSVRVGEYNIKNKIDCEVRDAARNITNCNPPVQDMKVEEIISHPQFVRGKNSPNDIALLRVSRFTYRVNVSPICLPVGEKRDLPVQNVIVTGWGVTDPLKPISANILHKVRLPVVDKSSCEKIYSQHEITLTSTQICAGGEEGRSACSGDAGGPMQFPAFVDGNFVYIQHGIVSFGPSYCGLKGYPSVFTSVKFYMDWILDNMKP